MKHNEKHRTAPEENKKERSPKETTSLWIGCISLVLSILTVLALLYVNSVVTLIFGICAVLSGFISLMIGRSGTLPSVVGIGAGFLSILALLITMRLQ